MEVMESSSRSPGSDLDSTEVYDPARCAVFFKTKEAYGGLSNMCGGFGLRVDGQLYRTSEAFYQALKFPDHPDILKMIREQASPLLAKNKAKPYKHLIRADWEDVKVELMRRCLRVKLEQHSIHFGALLRSTRVTAHRRAVQEGPVLGAVPREDGLLEGQNVLGKLLVELRTLVVASGSMLGRGERLAVFDSRASGPAGPADDLRVL